MPRAEYLAKLQGMRTVVATELLQAAARVSSGGSMKVGDVRVVTELKIRTNMVEEFAELARARQQPMMEVRRASGEVKSWGMWMRRFPSGAAMSHDAQNVVVYPDLASAVKGTDQLKAAEAFARANPGYGYADYVRAALAYAEIMNRLVFQIVALVDRPAATQTR
jgi:hypothetical protein